MGSKTASEQRTENDDSPAVHSLDDLLKLIVPERTNLTRARLDRALRSLGAAQLASLAAEIKDRIAHQQRRVWPPAVVSNAVAGHWLRLDPASAAAFVLHHPDFQVSSASDRKSFYAGMERLMHEDLPPFERLMANMDNRDFYIMTRLLYVDSFKGMDPAKALPLIVDFEFKTRNESFGADNYQEFPHQWIQNDPQAAINWAISLPPGRIRERLVDWMVRSWVDADAAAARAFYQGLSDKDLPAGALRKALAFRLDGTSKTRPQ
jgi:hypothetical protein